MASLMRPLLNRSLIASFRNTNLLSAIAVRNKATNTPTTGDSSSLAKPLEKKAVDPTADPKESCKFLFFQVDLLSDFDIAYLKAIKKECYKI